MAWSSDFNGTIGAGSRAGAGTRALRASDNRLSFLLVEVRLFTRH